MNKYLEKLIEQAKELLKAILDSFYAYEWVKRLQCRYSGHERVVKYVCYREERIIKNFEKSQIKVVKHKFDPYYIFSCKRCGKRLGTKQLARKLSKEEADEFSRNVILRMRAINEFKKEKK